MYLVCSLRTNVVFFIIFLTLTIAFGFLAAAYWYLALGEADYANTMLVAAGATTFVSDLAGWWIFFAILLASLDFPFQIPGTHSSHTIS